MSNGETDALDVDGRLEGLITLICESRATESEQRAMKLALGRLLRAVNDRLDRAIDARRRVAQ